MSLVHYKYIRNELVNSQNCCCEIVWVGNELFPAFDAVTVDGSEFKLKQNNSFYRI